jgi:hypothetical protein
MEDKNNYNETFIPIYDNKKKLWINKHGRFCSSLEVAKRDFQQTPNYGYYYENGIKKEVSYS